jgi:iron(III) transport system substrate-binding protein
MVGIAWNTDLIKDADAPKSWQDLLDPRFKGKISTFTSNASSPFFAWYLLPPVLGADYWEKMAQQQLKPYESSAQILDAIVSGETPISMQFSNTRLITVQEKNLPVKALWPAEGVPSYNSVQAILAKAPHPNAAKLFQDWTFSREGMTVAGKISGQVALRPDVPLPPSQPDISKLNLLVPADREEYIKAFSAFKPAWDKIVGMK